MKITPIFPKFNFTGSIIDAHIHYGNEEKYNIDKLLTFFNREYDGDKVEIGIISNLDCMHGKNSTKNEITGNEELLKAIEKHEEKFVPLAVCMPNNGNVSNIQKVFEKNQGKFKGLKFHPEGESLSASDKKYEPYLQFAQDNKLPCLFHCEIPWKQYSHGWDLIEQHKELSSPRKIYEAARKIPNTPVVMAHLGGGGKKVHQIALDTMLKSIEKGDAKLYADISWADCDDKNRDFLIKTIKTLKNTSKGDMTNRLMFGTDAPIGDYEKTQEYNHNGDVVQISGKQYYEKQVREIKQAIKNNFEEKEANKLIEDIFYNNAKKLYIDKEWNS